jgi:thioredoxin:protein disulfide reductase
MKVAVVTAGVLALATVSSLAQSERPRVDVRPSSATAIAAGAKGRVSVSVRLPKDIHVQSDKPDDPALIATVLTVPPVPGVSIDRIVYPAAAPLQQAGRATPLAVFGPDFTIEVYVSIAPSAAVGPTRIPAQLRYQACSERVCFAPARTAVEWIVTVAAQ